MVSTKSDYVRQFLADHPGIPEEEINKTIFDSNPELFGTRKRLGSVIQNVRITDERRKKNEVVLPHPPKEYNNGVPSAAISEDQLRAMFDIREIVFTELRTLKKKEYWKDADFVRRFQGRGAYRSILETPEAQKYKGKAAGQVFWSHPESIAEMKLRGVLL